MEQKDKKLNVLDYLMNKHMNYDDLLKGYNKLKIEVSEFEVKYNQLVNEYNELGTEYNHLSSKYDTLEDNYNEIEKNLKGHYNKKYKRLVEEYNEITIQFHEYIDYLENNSNTIKEIIIKQLELIDDIKDGIKDNTYLLIMNNLKKINDRLN